MKEFDRALSNYVREFANGGAIRHFVELGYSVDEIKEALDFPMSIEEIASVVWGEYVASGVICLNEEDIIRDYIVKIDYVKDYNKYGKTSLRKVTTKEPTETRQYVDCDFGKLIYKNGSQFISGLNKIAYASAKMIDKLPWPLNTVYVDAESRLGQAVIEYKEYLEQHNDV